MRKTSAFMVIVALLAFCPVTWAAEKMKEATVEYSADMVMEAAGTSSTGKVYHAQGGKDRMEMSAQGSTVITISRTDKKVAWMLMPAQNMYMEMSLEESAKKSGGTNVNDCEMDFSSLGDETVNGVKATKNKVSGSCPDNTKYDGTMWITKDNIMVKMDSVATVDGKQTNIKMDLKNLKIGKQDASLFEVPAGYQKFDMGSISSMMKASQAQANQAQADAEKARLKAAEEEDASESDTGRAYSGRAYSSSSDDSSSSEGTEMGNPVEKVDGAADKTNDTLDTTDKIKGTVNRLKGLFGK